VPGLPAFHPLRRARLSSTCFRLGHRTEHRVYRDISDPNRVVVHNDFPSEEAAKGFMEDPSLKEAMERAGVEGEPGISFMECAERKPYV